MTEQNFHHSLLGHDTFRQIFQSSAEGIIVVDREGNIVLANPVSERMFGYQEGELNRLHLSKLLPERLREIHIHHRQDYFKNPSPRRMGVGRDLLASRKDGSEFPVEVSLSYVNLKEGLIVIAFIIDITLRKKSEEALRRSEEQLIIYAAELERKVKSRTDALDKTIRELELLNRNLEEQMAERKKVEDEVHKALQRERELNDLKTKFVSTASHEFRTPLSAVLSSASLIRKYREKGDLEKIDKHIDRIKSSVSHLTNILNDFLSLGKLEEGKVDVTLELLDLDEVFGDIIEELKLTLKSGQDITFDTEGAKRTVLSDQKVIRNIAYNLISNASKYSEEGKMINVRIAYLPRHIAIHIRDEGIGIPEEETKHIFERFFRASNASNIQGTGLGLNIVSRYVALLKGNVEFTSEYGKGSTFTITVPY